MEYSKDESSQVNPTEEKILHSSRSLPTDIDKVNRPDPSNFGSLPDLVLLILAQGHNKSEE